MNQRRMAIFVAVVVLAVSACTAQEPLATRLDTSGLTVVTVDEAIVLARPVRQLTVAARDYAYIGPVEINRMGNRDHYLWVGLASTVDRKLADATPLEADSLALVVDGQPMILPLRELNMTLDNLPYRSTVPLYATLFAHASLDQIERIAAAYSVDLYIVTSTGGTDHYQRWRGDWHAWSALAD